MKKAIILIIVVILAVVFFFFKPETPKVFSQDQKIGQLFMIGIEGKTVTSEVETLIKTLHPGGILLLKKNIESEVQVKKLTSDLQKIALADTGIPLIIAVDQEGGQISRIDWVNKTPQSAINTEEEAFNIAKERGSGLKSLGINLNLAPLLDSANEGDFIFERTFQKTLDIIGNFGKKMIEGQNAAGILTAVKHFPGYGNISFNPEDNQATLLKIPEISQFQKANEASPSFIMVTDVIYKDIDGTTPFVFSKKGIDFLREKIAGNYLIISDDLDQRGFLTKTPLVDIISMPIKAGVNFLIFSGYILKPESGISAFKDAVLQKKITDLEINENFTKILKLKEKIR